MSSGTVALPRPQIRRRAVPAAAAARRLAAWPHLPGLAAQLALALWLCRGFASSAIPAGTDTLGFISRAASNARGDVWLSALSPDSLGAPRQITLESLLGVLTKATGSPFLTVKLFMLATLVASGAGAYWLAWRWYRSRAGAAIAGLLYMTSQISLAQTASGHLNVCVVIALAPMMIGLSADCVEQFSLRRACLLGVALALLVLARPDMPIYVVPLAALYVPIRGIAERRLWVSLRNALLTGCVALFVALALSLYEVVPLLGGVHAAWVSGGGLFKLADFDARSVPALASLLGFAREIGYLAFTGRQTWFSHPWLSFGVYAALAVIPVAAAWAVLALRRNTRTLYLLTCAVAGAFAAKGFYGPLGGAYKWAVLHVPLVSNLRDPNRWLIVGSLAIAVLAGVAATRLPQLWRWIDATRPAKLLTAAAILCAVALPNGPTIVSGLATWRPTPGQMALLDVARRGVSPVATVPFDQTRRYLIAGNYEGWEHDLGSESLLWTGRPALQDGGWSHSAASTVAYLTTLLGRRDPTFAPLLASLGVGDVLSFGYSPTSPHLLNPADPYYQQQALPTMPGLAAAARTAGGTMYSVAGAVPAVSAPSLRAVVLGGRSGLRALLRIHGIDPDRWAAEDAGGLLASGGESGLLAAIRDANFVVVADASLSDLAVAAAPPIVRLPGISSDVQDATATETLPPSVATQSGALVDENAPAPAIGAQVTKTSFVIPHAAGPVELWAHVRALHDAAKLDFFLDGRSAGAITPLAPADAGFSWTLITARTLGAGRHTLAAAASPSPYGDSYELDSVRLVRAATRKHATRALTAALASAAPRVAYASDLGDALRSVSDHGFFSPVSTIGGGPGYWKVLESERATLAGSHGAVALSFRGGRQYHALLVHYFAQPRDWSGHAYAFLRVRGTASGAAYRVLLDGDIHHHHTIELPWVDNQSGWRLLAIPLLADPSVARHVISLRLGADDETGGGQLQVGAFSLSGSRSGVRVTLPIPPSLARRAKFVDLRGTSIGSMIARPVSQGLSVRIALSKLGEHSLLLVTPPAGAPRAPSAVLRYRSAGTNRFSVDVSSIRPFTLVLDRASDPGWQLTGVRGAIPVRTWGTLQAWQLPAGRYVGTISFRGDRLVRLGAAMSGFFAVLLAALFVAVAVRRRRRGDGRVSAGSVGAGSAAGRARPASRRTWRIPLAAALVLLLASPLTVIHGPSAAGDYLAVAATAMMAIAIILGLASIRRSWPAEDS